jgi:hypothetical protein
MTKPIVDIHNFANASEKASNVFTAQELIYEGRVRKCYDG